MAADPRPLVLVSGFGPFEAFDVNPSGVVAERLAADPPAGLRVQCAVLPVSFARAPEVWERHEAHALGPALYLGLGVQRKAGFLLEHRAGPRLKRVPRPDVDGHLPAEFSAEGPTLATSIDLEGVLAGLRRKGVADARLSRSAGGYVCECLYHRLLQRAAAARVPGLFVHVPPVRFASVERQVQVVGWILTEILTGARSADGPPR